MGFMVGQQYQCQDCQEVMIIPVEFKTNKDYITYLKAESPQHPNLQVYEEE